MDTSKASLDRFEQAYVKRRHDGKTGWVDRDGANWQIHLSCLVKTLGAPYCPKGGKALDLGCGAGCWSIELARRGYTVTGVDISPTAIAWARDKAREEGREIRFCQANVLELRGWVPGEYDFILDGFVLHCLVRPEDRRTYLRTAHGLLGPGGVFLVQSFAAEDLDDEGWHGWNIDRTTRCEISEEGVPARYVGTPRSIRDEVVAAGFVVLEEEMVPIGGGMLQLAAGKNR
jgi:2-polyprenyl-3-methyl-5-hydroxy-6-metoxy-1,4-benzoquinol methylase